MAVKKFIRYFLISCIVWGIGFGFTACKKYPEDGHFSLQTAKKRLRAHPWYLNKLYVNGADSTLVHLQRMDPARTNPSDFSFYFKEGMDIHTNGGKAVTTNVLKDKEIKFYLEGKKRVLKITEGDGCYRVLNNYHMFWKCGLRSWEIKKLTKEELVLENRESVQFVRIEFKNQ